MQESGVHHIDLNFGCPVKKVTSKGGGSALPLRPRLLARLVRAAVKGTGSEVPLTVKLRVGLSLELKTFMEVRCYSCVTHFLLWISGQAIQLPC